jgi:hypothetical protein
VLEINIFDGEKDKYGGFRSLKKLATILLIFDNKRMPIWLIPAAITAFLTTFGCGRVGFEELPVSSKLSVNTGPDGGKINGAADAGADAYSSQCSPDAALQHLCVGLDGGK